MACQETDGIRYVSLVNLHFRMILRTNHAELVFDGSIVNPQAAEMQGSIRGHRTAALRTALNFQPLILNSPIATSAIKDGKQAETVPGLGHRGLTGQRLGSQPRLSRVRSSQAADMGMS